jgi:hypothetical protein
MGLLKKKKCCHCKVLFIPDARNATRQNYCAKPPCGKASKAASQQRWLQKEENRDYFRAPVHVKRVQQWRKAHPGYWRRKPKTKSNALQDPLNFQATENIINSIKFENDALQDLLTAQPFVLIGLIANITGFALQDDIAMVLRRMQQLGSDIINPNLKGGRHGAKTSDLSPAYQKSPQAVQLARPPTGPGPLY